MVMESGGNVQTPQTATNMKASIVWTKKTGWVLLHGKAAICIKAVTRKTKGMATVKCIGQTAAVTRVNGKMVSSTVLVKWNSLTVGSKRVILKTMFIVSRSLMRPNFNS